MFKFCLIFSFLRLSLHHSSFFSHYKFCTLTRPPPSLGTLHMCFNQAPNILHSPCSLVECSLLCQSLSHDTHHHRLSYYSVANSFSYAHLSPDHVRVVFEYLNFTTSYPLPLSVASMTSSGRCFAFQYGKESRECGLFTDQGRLPSLSATSNPCNLYQRREKRSLCYFAYKDCGDVPTAQSGVQWIVVASVLRPVYCAFSAGKKYTVIQRRTSAIEDFNKKWLQYEHGFGDLNENFWLGNRAIHQLTSSDSYVLRLEMETFDGNSAYQEYFNFSVGNAASFYPLHWTSTNGSAGNAFPVSSTAFTTSDRDNDNNPHNCASLHSGGWWFDNCHAGNPNGEYLGIGATAYAKAINWSPFRGYQESMSRMVMMLKKQT